VPCLLLRFIEEKDRLDLSPRFPSFFQAWLAWPDCFDLFQGLGLIADSFLSSYRYRQAVPTKV